MTRKRLILLVGLGALAGGVILFVPRGPKEPVFEGQKLGYWIRRSLESADPKMEEQAERAVKAAGTNALPYLMDQFTRRSSRWERTIHQISRRFKTSVHAETEDERIALGVFGLTVLGPDVASVMPSLAKELNDPKRGPAAVIILDQCGDEAVPLVRKWRSSNTILFVPHEWMRRSTNSSEGSR